MKIRRVGGLFLFKKKGGDFMSTFTIVIIVGFVIGLGAMVAIIMSQGKPKR